MAYFQQALRIYRDIGDRRGEGTVLGNIGLTFADLGDYIGARAYLEQALHLAREIGDRESVARTLSNLSWLSSLLGGNEAAREYSRQALLIVQEIGSHHLQGDTLTNLGHALAGLDRLREATESYQQALSLGRELGEHYTTMEALAGLARVSLAQSDLAQAHVDEILSHLKTNTLDGAREPFRVYLTCYRVLRANQDPRAQAILDTAHRLLQERAAKISDKEMRRSFLENVPAHREILHLLESGGARHLWLSGWRNSEQAARLDNIRAIQRSSREGREGGDFDRGIRPDRESG